MLELDLVDLILCERRWRVSVSLEKIGERRRRERNRMREKGAYCGALVVVLVDYSC